MYEAENLLNEYDWEWDWDIGQGYNDAENAELQRVREIVSQGIKAYYADTELVRKDIEAEQLADERQQRIYE